MAFKKFGILLAMTAKWHHGGLSMRGRLIKLRLIHHHVPNNRIFLTNSKADPLTKTSCERNQLKESWLLSCRECLPLRIYNILLVHFTSESTDCKIKKKNLDHNIHVQKSSTTTFSSLSEFIHTALSCDSSWHVLLSRPCPSLMANGSAWIFDMLYQTWEFNQILYLLNSWTAFKKFATSPGFDVLTLTRHKENLPIPELSKLGNSYRQTVEKQFARDQLISSWHPCTKWTWIVLTWIWKP